MERMVLTVQQFNLFIKQKEFIFENIGESDYSSLVDFNNMKNIMKKMVVLFSITNQRDFLLKWG